VLQLQFQVPGDALPALNRGFTRFTKGAETPFAAPVGNQIADDFISMERKAFASGGQSSGTQWQKLSPDYAAWKLAKFGQLPVLTRTGELRSALTVKTNKNALRVVKPKEIQLGIQPNGLLYRIALYHQTGTGPMPKRPPIHLRSDHKHAWVRFVQKRLAKLAHLSFKGTA